MKKSYTGVFVAGTASCPEIMSILTVRRIMHFALSHIHRAGECG
jgi:hypothetical protein